MPLTAFQNRGTSCPKQRHKSEKDKNKELQVPFVVQSTEPLKRTRDGAGVGVQTTLSMRHPREQKWLRGVRYELSGEAKLCGLEFSLHQLSDQCQALALWEAAPSGGYTNFLCLKPMCIWEARQQQSVSLGQSQCAHRPPGPVEVVWQNHSDLFLLLVAFTMLGFVAT